jgi:hypothetical protein
MKKTIMIIAFLIGAVGSFAFKQSKVYDATYWWTTSGGTICYTGIPEDLSCSAIGIGRQCTANGSGIPGPAYEYSSYEYRCVYPLFLPY